MVSVHIKPETEMTAAANEDCLRWRRNETFDSERFKPMKVGFPDGGNESIFGCWLGIFPIPSVFHKDSGE